MYCYENISETHENMENDLSRRHREDDMEVSVCMER